VLKCKLSDSNFWEWDLHVLISVFGDLNVWLPYKLNFLIIKLHAIQMLKRLNYIFLQIWNKKCLNTNSQAMKKLHSHNLVLIYILSLVDQHLRASPTHATLLLFVTLCGMVHLSCKLLVIGFHSTERFSDLHFSITLTHILFKTKHTRSNSTA